MQKTTKVMNIIAAVLQVVAFVAFLFIVIFQRQIKGIYTGSPEVLAQFIFPTVQFIVMLLATLFVALPVVGSFIPWRIPLFEIAAIVLLAVVCPLVNTIGAPLQAANINQYGSSYVAAYGALNNALTIAASISGLAKAFAYVGCGMGIVAKRLSPKA